MNMRIGCLLIVILMLGTFPLAAAFEFTAVLSSGPREQSQMHGIVDGANAKIEFAGGNAAGMEKGTYMLTRDGGQTVALVNPAEKTYIRMNPEQMASSVGSLMNSAKGFMSMSFKNPSVVKLSDEKGPDMFGMPTRYFKTRTSYTVETSVLGSKSASDVVQEEEVWVTTKMKDPGFKNWLSSRNLRTGNEEIDKMIELESAKIQGFHLKTKSRTVTRDARGREETVNATYEITNIKETAVKGGTFEIPEDYTDGMAALGDELRRVQKGMDEDEGGESGATKETINSLMKGLFDGRR